MTPDGVLCYNKDEFILFTFRKGETLIKQYINCHYSGSKLLLRGIDENNNFVSEKLDYQPTVWVEKNMNLHEFKADIVGTDSRSWKHAINKSDLIAVQFKDIRSTRSFISKNTRFGKDEDGKNRVISEKVYTAPSNPFVAQYLCETFKDAKALVAKDLRIYTYDIETEVGHRDVPNDSMVQARTIVDKKSFFKQDEKTIELPIIEFETLPERNTWELLDESKGEWVSYEQHPFRFIGGFPEPTKANEKITLITVKDVNKNHIYTWGLNEFTTDRKDITYFHCNTETILLERFLQFWESDYPHIVTGWNTLKFDNTYLVNRINKILGEGEANRLSPYGEISMREGKVDEDKPNFNNRQDIETTFSGIADLDYLRVYKKFGTYSAKESYKLDFICEEELGIKKIPNPTGGSFRDFYTGEFEVYEKPKETDHEIKKLGFERTQIKESLKEHPERKAEYEALDAKIKSMCHQVFTEYNIRDVELVDKLDKKKRLIDLVLQVSYMAHVNYEDVFSPVKTWDYIIYNHLNALKQVIPHKVHASKTEKFVGAYVKTPLVGKHEYCVSFDLD